MATPTASRPSIDGRTARAERTRVAIADAMLALFEEGDLRPTAPRVAERAGVSLRSVFQHFEDMEAINAAVAERQIERVMSSARFIPRDGPLPDRIHTFVAERARQHEQITPVRRAGLLIEPFSEVIAARLRWARNLGAVEVRKVFRIELDALAASERRDAAEAITVASSWQAWEVMRAHQNLSAAQAQRVLRRSIAALLRPAEDA
jgi:AcrR family transcriptional regulator